jgi:hypothetical protein
MTPTKNATIIKRRQIVAHNILAGATYREIASVVKVSPSTIATDFKAILAEWRKHYADTADRYINLQMRRYDILLNALWDRATNGDIHATDRVLAIMEKQNALMRIHDGTITPPSNAPHIQIIEIVKNIIMPAN